MSSYRPKSLDELNNMYDKALSAQRAIKRGTSKINETNTSESFFDDIIKEAELTLEKEPEKPIADLSVAVDDFIKHFSDAEKKNEESSATRVALPKAKAPDTHKPVEAPKIKAEKKPEPVVATPSPAIARKQSGEHISNLMSDYIKIMNDQDDSDEDEPRQRKSFLSRKKEKKLNSKEAFKEEDGQELSQEPTYTPLSEELKEEVFPFENPVSDEELTEKEEAPSVASEEAFNAFSAMNKTKESFHNEIAKEEPLDAEAEAEEAEELFEEAEAEEAQEEAEAEEAQEKAEALEETEDMFDDLSSHSDEEDSDEETSEEDDEKEQDEETPVYSKGKNALRATARVFLSIICAATLVLSLFCASLSTVFNINTGKEVFGKYYFFTSSHDFAVSGVNAGDLVICEKQSTVSDDETAVYIDLENRTFSFGLKDGSITNSDGDVVYLIGDNEVMRDDVLGTVYKTVPALGDVITLVYEYYVPVIAALVGVTVVLLLVVIFALKKRRFEETDEEEESEEDAQEEAEEASEASEEELDTDIFAELE